MKKAQSTLGQWKTKCQFDPQSAPFCKAETVPDRKNKVVVVVTAPTIRRSKREDLMEIARNLDRNLGLVQEKVLQPT